MHDGDADEADGRDTGNDDDNGDRTITMTFDYDNGPC